MMDIEKALKEQKKQIDQINAPAELKPRLETALNAERKRKSQDYRWPLRAAAAIMVVFLAGYNFNTLAYYGKRMIGFEGLMTDTVSELVNSGLGQDIGTTYAFDNGVNLTIDGVMIDYNNLILFYTFSGDLNFDDPDKIFNLPSVYLKGFFETIEHNHSVGSLDEDNREIKFVSYYDPPRALTRQIKIESYSMGDSGFNLIEDKVIIDRSKAMGKILKQSVAHTFKVGNRDIKIDELIATPTATSITGSIQNIFQLARDSLSDNRIRPNSISMSLWANGRQVDSQSSSLKTDSKGITFKQDFDVLPEDTKSIQILLESVTADYDVDENFALTMDNGEKNIRINNQHIAILDVWESDSQTCVKIRTEDHLYLSEVFLEVDGTKAELAKTVENQTDKLKSGRIERTRTMYFDKSGEDMNLNIKRITYKTDVYQSVKIKVN
jgi:hypothetical protein